MNCLEKVDLLSNQSYLAQNYKLQVPKKNLSKQIVKFYNESKINAVICVPSGKTVLKKKLFFLNCF